jgi:hypothetical protein
MAWVLDSKPHIGQGRVGEVAPGIDQGLGQYLKSLRGQRSEQAAAIGEVVRGRGMRDACAPGQLAQRDSVGATLGHQARGFGQDHRAQIAVVVVRAVHTTSISSELDSD